MAISFSQLELQILLVICPIITKLPVNHIQFPPALNVYLDAMIKYFFYLSVSLFCIVSDWFNEILQLNLVTDISSKLAS